VVRLSEPMSVGSSGLHPTSFIISEAFPNPFNNSIGIKIDVNNMNPIDFLVFNVMGEMVYSEKIMPLRKGVHSFAWMAKSNYGQDLPSGIYFLQLNSLNHRSNRKITYLK
jgi:flagellar hook assembly protein FlgD